MLKRLFKPEEVKAALRALDIVRERTSNGVWGLAWGLIENDIRKIIVNQADKTVAFIKEDKHSPETLVHLLMTNVLAEKLGTHEYQMYRQLLSMAGSFMLPLWDYAVEQLLESGFCDKAKADKEKQWIRDQIKKIV